MHSVLVGILFVVVFVAILAAFVIGGGLLLAAALGVFGVTITLNQGMILVLAAMFISSLFRS